MDRVRLYESLRSAHLERARALAPATIVYRVKRYDFDDSLAAGLDLVQAGPIRTALLLARSTPQIVEINEPLMTSSLVSTAIALVGIRIGEIRHRRRALIVSYAIENDDPFARARPARLRSRVRRGIERRLARLLWRRLDRVVFGTAGAETTYRSALGHPARATSVSLVPALPEPADDGVIPRDANRVLFVGALQERKGVPNLLAAWPLVSAAAPRARLTVIGTGPLEGDVREACLSDATIELIVDPPRDEIHRAYAGAHVVTLPSQRTPRWREQVGLPIIEGLAHGCRIVTTDETGLAEWLAAHGHEVVPAASSEQVLAEALVRAVLGPVDPAAVTAPLPVRDGRLAADDVLFASRDSR